MILFRASVLLANNNLWLGSGHTQLHYQGVGWGGGLRRGATTFPPGNMYTSVTWTYGAHARTELASKLSTLAAVTLAVLPTCTALENHTAEQGGWTWYHIGFGAVVTAATAVFVAIGASHLAATWILRKEFDVAIRYPIFERFFQ